MAADFLAYTNEGTLRGEFDDAARLGEALEHNPEITLGAVQLEPLRGGAATGHGNAAIATEDLLLVVAPPETSTPVHAAWNPVGLVVPPYFVEGELPTLPGFDPGRALSRPGGLFVLLGHVRISALSSNDAQRTEHEFAWVNRYAVEQIESDLELQFYFPGATQLPGRRTDPPLSGAPAA